MSDSATGPLSKLWEWLFSKRTVLLAVLLIGGAELRFWLHSQRLRGPIQAIEAAGGRVRVRYELLQVFREPMVSVHGLPQFGDDGLQYLTVLTGLYSLGLSNTQVSDDGLKYLAGLKKLTRLYLAYTQISDDGLKYLAGLIQLRALDLRDTQVSDEGLKQLAGLTELFSLNLYDTQVSDEGLRHLTGLTELRFLDLKNTQITDEGMTRLRRALPRCIIRRN